jgi:ABC-type sugar transport system substrate-binding protein
MKEINEMNPSREWKTIALAALAASALAFSGCAGAKTSTENGTIGVSLNSLEYPFIVTMNEAMNDEAISEDVRLITVDSRAKVATELSQIEDLLTQNVDVVVMDAVDAESSEAAGKRVNAADVPLILVDNRFAEDSDVDVVSYIGTDAMESGRLQAEYLNDQLPDGGKIIYLVGVYGAPWTENRKAGFFEVLNDNFEIATETEAKGSRADGKTVMEDLLRRYSTPGEIVALVAQNDEMAIGAISAIEEAGREDEFAVIVSVDGSEAGLEAVASGRLSATILQDPDEIGRVAIQTAKKVAAGEDVEREIFIPFETVTADNVADFQ